jgi:hypothetical protein
MEQDPDELIALPPAEFEALLERAAETGARRALHEVGLDGQDAAEDIVPARIACCLPQARHSSISRFL